MAEATATVFRVPADFLPKEVSMTTKTTQIESDLEVPRSEVRPLRIAMNSELLEAARSGDKDILDKLLRPDHVSSSASVGEITVTVSEDAAVQKDTRCLLGVTLEGNTALHIVASRGHLELAKKICEREISLLTAQNTRLDTPLHCAARVGDHEMVSHIIQFASQGEIEARRVLRARNRDEANALHEAAKYNHVRVAEVLMEENAGLASMLNSDGMSPLYLATMTGSLDVAKALLQSSSWESVSPASYAGPNKQTALHAAVLMMREITQDLLHRKPMLAKDVDFSGRIPLHYAALDGHHDTVKLLLECDRSTAYLSDDDGFFPIHLAASMGNVLIVDQILEQCPEAHELLDRRGRNFIHIAFQWEELDVVKEIISKRPDLRKLLNDQDNEGNTPLHTAVTNSDQGSVHFLLRDISVFPNIINHDGLAPLDLAYTELVEGQQYWMNASHVRIASCLALIKVLSGPRELHDLRRVELCYQKRRVELSTDKAKGKPFGDEKFKESSNNEGNEIGRQVQLARNLGISSVLIATVTFAAGFTVPGGYIADDHPDRGTAVLAKEYAFKVFLISDAVALVCSIAATCWLMYAGTSIIGKHTRIRALLGAVSCLWVAFAGMSSAFAMGIYVVLPPSYKSIIIPCCIISLGTPLLTHMVVNYDLYSLVRTVGSRQGYICCIWAIIHSYDKKRAGRNLLHDRDRIIFLLLTLVGYAVFFLSAIL